MASPDFGKPPALGRQITLKSSEDGAPLGAPGCLMIGTGEYTTGYVGGCASDSDKGAGVVGLVMFDLRKRWGGFFAECLWY